MKSELHTYLKDAKPKEDHKFLKGIKQTESDFNILKIEMQQSIPESLKSMFFAFEIASLILEFKNINEEERSIQFNTFKHMEDACLNMYPGCAIFKLGFVGIGEDPTGSGDPYFINIQEGENPPVYQIYHDVSDKGEEILESGKVLVAHKLSDIFKNQLR